MSKKLHTVFENFSYQLVLASSSPRRQELLKYLGVPFTVAVPDIEERHQPHESPAEYVQRNAREKAEVVFHALKPKQALVVIGSDTIGFFQGHVLEKPIDAEDAKRMLRSLSGGTHEVLTGLAVVYGTEQKTQTLHRVVTTKVTFKALTEQEIGYYVGTGEPLDKAGSYGIQAIGGFLVERLDGSYSNVVGLPLVELVDLLRCLPDPAEIV